MNIVQAIKLILVALRKFHKELGLNILVLEWVAHYFSGSKRDKTLPLEAIAKTKEAVLDWLDPEYAQYSRVNTQYGDHLNSGSTNCREDDKWWNSMKGVIGAFNFEFEATEEVLLAHCWDTWDFNPYNTIELEVPPLLWRILNPFRKYWEGFVCYENANELWLDEEKLADSFNLFGSFTTRWDVVIDWAEMPEGCKEATLKGDKCHPYYLHISGGYAWYSRDLYFGYPGGKEAWLRVYGAEKRHWISLDER